MASSSALPQHYGGRWRVERMQALLRRWDIDIAHLLVMQARPVAALRAHVKQHPGCCRKRDRNDATALDVALMIGRPRTYIATMLELCFETHLSEERLVQLAPYYCQLSIPSEQRRCHHQGRRHECLVLRRVALGYYEDELQRQYTTPCDTTRSLNPPTELDSHNDVAVAATARRVSEGWHE